MLKRMKKTAATMNVIKRNILLAYALIQMTMMTLRQINSSALD